ncbi:metalloprotease PmbA [Methylomonas sp. LL1]|uniref:metalloprotease PmbA n=1 Tax=Methylomonas sp. LL1 TaxID=2785785 RepID=UPI0018C3B363|nr:metalloprotease PmbA [Methylomonas sp. LL1]QPK63090.1 metalloprotease PmbA [Methylomonas sp. LL1]
MQNQDEINRLKTVVQTILDEAKQQGASAAEAAFSVDNGLSVSARLGDVETIEYHCDQGIGVTVYFGRKKGSASTNDVSPDSLKETVKAACSIARYASEDEYAGLPDPDRLATEFPDLDLNHPWAIDAENAITLAIECENAARSYDKAISNSEGASVNSHQGTRVFGNSLGFLQGYQSTRHSISCAVLGGSGDAMQRDYWYSVARNPVLMESARYVGEKAAQRTVARLDARSLSTRQCPVLFAPEMASGLIGTLLGAISGSSLYRKSSFLLDSLNTSILPDFVRIHEQPLLVGGLGSASYDAEGVATQARDIVSQGILRSYILSTYSARKLGMQTTGNAGGVHNLIVEPGENDFAGMLKLLNTGLLVTELMGQGVNRVTGDYSRGATGFWVENGVIQYPVQEITIAGNLKTMLRNMVAIGKDVDLRGNIQVGSILLEQMAIAGE